MNLTFDFKASYHMYMIENFFSQFMYMIEKKNQNLFTQINFFSYFFLFYRKALKKFSFHVEFRTPSLRPRVKKIIIVNSRFII